MTDTQVVEPVDAETGGEHPTTRRSTRLVATVDTVLLLTGLLIFGLVLPHYVVADAMVRYENLRTLLHGHVPPGRYSLISPVFATPLLVIDKLAGTGMYVTELYNTLVFAVGILALFLLLRRSVPAPLLRRFLLVLVAGSMFAAHVVHWNSEVFTAMAVAVGLAAAAVGRFRTPGAVAVVLGVANTPASIVGLVLVTGGRLIQERRVRYALAVVAAVAVMGAENWIRNGSPLRTGYGGDHSFRTLMPYSGGNGFDYPFFFGLLSLLLSFGKGLLFFAPGLVLPVRAVLSRIRLGAEMTLYRLYGWWLLFLAGLVVVYSPWFAWYGGFTWGPRFMLFASVPAALAIAAALGEVTAPLWSRLLTLSALALSVWVALCGSVFMQAAFPQACSTDDFAFEAFCHYTPDYSVLWYPLVAHLPVRGVDWLVVGYFAACFGWLAAPLVRSVVRDVRAPVRRSVALAFRGWRW